jgi:flagellar hook-basal body complex protein FliE
VALPIASITSSIASPVARAASSATPNAASPTSGSFTDSLSRLVDSVDSSDKAANAAVEQMLDGSGDVHDAMIALQRAELTLQLTVQMRNKLVQAYQDIMRMPV